MKRAITVILALVAVLVGATLIWELAYDDYAGKAKELAETAGSAD